MSTLSPGVKALVDPPAAGPPALPSPAVRRATGDALRRGATHYTERAGLPAARRALAHALGGVAPERVIITSGRPEGLFLAVCGLTVPGAIVGVCDAPTAELVVSLRRTAVLTDAWRPACELVVTDDPGAAVGALTGGALAVLSARPGDGPVDAETLRAAQRGAVIVGDLASAGLGAWGAGFVLAPVELIDAMVELKQGLNICTAAFAQHAAAAAAEDAGTAGRADRPPAPSRRWPARPALADAGTRERYELLDRLAATPGAISLGRGDPDLPTPAAIVDAAVAAIEERLVPGDVSGLPSLRRAIAGKLAADNGVIADPESEILVTTGGQEAIFLLLQALLGPGDEVLMGSPRYTAYDVAVAAAGARIVSVPPRGPLDFRLDAAALEARITPRTRALLIISPGNPTAAVASRAELEAVAAVAARHGLTVIADEMYERIVYAPATHVSLASLPGMGARTVTVGGFSKAYAMTGWRVGYLAGPAELVAAVRDRKRLWSGPTSMIAQRGALAALSAGRDLAAEAVAVYTRRRATALSALRAMGVSHAPAQGAFYAFCDLSELGLPAYEISRRLLDEAGVFVYPGSGFGAEWGGHIRLAWLAGDDRLDEALNRMAGWIEARR